MSYDVLKNSFYDNGILRFRLYSLDYIIRTNMENVEIYTILYPSDKKIYSSFDELMDNYRIFNVPLKSYMNRIII